MHIFEVRINNNTCTGCNACVVSCPVNFNQLKTDGELTRQNAVLLVKNGVAYPIYDEDRSANCDGCGICIVNCAQKAIKVEILNI